MTTNPQDSYFVQVREALAQAQLVAEEMHGAGLMFTAQSASLADRLESAVHRATIALDALQDNSDHKERQIANATADYNMTNG